MATIIATIGGTPTPGNLLMISFSPPPHPRGSGVSTLKYRIPQPVDTIVTDPETGAKTVKSSGNAISDAVEGLYNEFWKGYEWPLSAFDVTKRGDNGLVIKQTDMRDNLSNLSFRSEVEGTNGRSIYHLFHSCIQRKWAAHRQSV
jgi:hypothetical protein